MKDGSEVELTARSPFWKGLREYSPMSPMLGYYCSDIDAQMFNWRSGSFLVFEHKCRDVMPEPKQTNVLALNNAMYEAAAPSGSYRGMFLIQHSGESTEDGPTTIYQMSGSTWVLEKNCIGFTKHFYGNEVFEFIRGKLL